MSDLPTDDTGQQDRAVARGAAMSEEARIGRMQDDISRMRSVLFELVKDQPDMLRLLGLPEPTGSGKQ